MSARNNPKPQPQHKERRIPALPNFRILIFGKVNLLTALRHVSDNSFSNAIAAL
jgi:hypothetical protein